MYFGGHISPLFSLPLTIVAGMQGGALHTGALVSFPFSSLFIKHTHTCLERDPFFRWAPKVILPILLFRRPPFSAAETGTMIGVFSFLSQCAKRVAVKLLFSFLSMMPRF